MYPTRWSLVKHVVRRGASYPPSLSVFLCLSHPLSSLSLQGGAAENPVDHGRPCLFPQPPLSLHPSRTTLAAPWCHDWPPQSALISHIDSCQSTVWAALWQAEALIDGRYLCVFTCINSMLSVRKYQRLFKLKFVVDKKMTRTPYWGLWGFSLFETSVKINYFHRRV